MELICDNRLRYLVVEKTTMEDFPEDCYFAFKFVYNKERVHVFQFNTEEDVLHFCSLQQGFTRKAPGGVYPRWIENIKENKYQIKYRSRLMENAEYKK